MPHKLSTHPAHLGLGASAVVEPRFTGIDWYAGYGARHAVDGVEGRLVSMHVWHTADVDAPATALFITAGWGTQMRER